MEKHLLAPGGGFQRRTGKGDQGGCAVVRIPGLRPNDIRGTLVGRRQIEPPVAGDIGREHAQPGASPLRQIGNERGPGRRAVINTGVFEVDEVGVFAGGDDIEPAIAV